VKKYFAALLFLCVTVLLGAMPIEAQQKVGSKTNATATTKATTCTENNGKPCPEWLHRIVGQYPPTATSRL